MYMKDDDNETNQSKPDGDLKNNNPTLTKSFILEDEMVQSESLENNVMTTLVNKQLCGKVVNVVSNSLKP